MVDPHRRGDCQPRPGIDGVVLAPGRADAGFEDKIEKRIVFTNVLLFMQIYRIK